MKKPNSVNRTTEQKAELIKKVHDLKKTEGLTIQAACNKAGIHLSSFYTWTSKAKKNNKSVLVRKTKDAVVTTTHEDSIPVILTRLTPSQLSAFMRN